MLEVPGELIPVMRGYEEEFAKGGFKGSGLVQSENGLILSTSAAGGGTLTAVAGVEESSYVLIERCTD